MRCTKALVIRCGESTNVIHAAVTDRSQWSEQSGDACRYALRSRAHGSGNVSRYAHLGPNCFVFLFLRARGHCFLCVSFYYKALCHSAIRYRSCTHSATRVSCLASRFLSREGMHIWIYSLGLTVCLSARPPLANEQHLLSCIVAFSNLVSVTHRQRHAIASARLLRHPLHQRCKLG